MADHPVYASSVSRVLLCWLLVELAALQPRELGAARNGWRAVFLVPGELPQRSSRPRSSVATLLTALAGLIGVAAAPRRGRT